MMRWEYGDENHPVWHTWVNAQMPGHVVWFNTHVTVSEGWTRGKTTTLISRPAEKDTAMWQVRMHNFVENPVDTSWRWHKIPPLKRFKNLGSAMAYAEILLKLEV